MNHVPSLGGRAARIIAAVAVCGLALTLAPAAMAQNRPFDPPTNVVESSNIGFRAGSIIAAPVPFESPALGTGLALGGGYLFRNDRLSDASSIGFGGFRTSNDSEGYGLGLNLAWDDNRWTVQLLTAEARLNYDLYVGGFALPVSQDLTGTRLKVGYSPFDDWSFGGSLDFGEYALSREASGILPEELRFDARLKIARFTGVAEYDTSDDSFYPTKGLYVNGQLTYGEFIDLDRDAYGKIVLSGRSYATVGRDRVVATAATVCASSDDAPFFDSCALGAADNFRGYVATEFIGDGLVSIQAELRGQLVGRLGYVVFAGAGAVGDTLGRAITGGYNAAAGVGLRIRLSREFPLDYAIDLARNERGENLLYVSVGQRF
jgi:outer membrane protein assembly factor BamA